MIHSPCVLQYSQYGRIQVTETFRRCVQSEKSAVPGSVPLTSVLTLLGISSSSRYRRSKATAATRGRPRDPLDPAQVAMIRALAERYPYWGYKRLAALARR